MTYDNTNRGVLFVNDKKGNEKAPDRTGKINVDGVDFKLAGWIKEGKKGQFLSLSIQKQEERGAAQEHHSEPARNLDDDIVPF